MSDARIIKRYANRKLHDTEHSYVTLDQIGEMVRHGDDVKVVDNKTKEDLTTITLAQITTALRNQLVVSDASFDRLFPMSERFRSRFHWTPVDIAKRACALLAPGPGRRILDVGSGVGKLCLVGALTRHAHWVGVEQDRGRVDVATHVAQRLGVGHHVQFAHGDATAIDWSPFDSVYLFNPFADQLIDREMDVMSRRERFVWLVERAQQRLIETRPGTRVVTYYGIGGDVPTGFELVHREPAGEDQLCVWTRVAQRRHRRDPQQ